MALDFNKLTIRSDAGMVWKLQRDINTQKQMIVFRPPPKVKNLRDIDANKLTILKIQITHHFKDIELKGINPSLTK